MKILYQSPSLIPSQTANSVHVMSISDQLSRMGHEVKLLVFKGGLDNKKSDHEYYGANTSFEIKKFSVVGRLGKLKFLIFSIFNALLFRPDLIITRFVPGAYLFVLFGYQVVLDAHHPVWIGSPWKKILYNLFKKNKNFRKFTTNSNSLKKIFHESGMSPRCQISVAHNGSKNYPLNEKLSLKTKNGINIGYLGSIYKGRGVDLIIKIASRLEDCNFHIAGGSEFEIEEIHRQYKIPQNLFFYGYIQPSKAYLFRNSCDILLAPYSRKGVMVANGKEDSSQYMNPIKIIEYMSSKKPIIASDLVPIREIINDKQALLVDPDKVEEWIVAINKLIHSKNLRNELAENAYSYFSTNLTWRARAEKLIA